MPVSASTIYFLNLLGDVLINRLYWDDVGGNMVDVFRMHLMQKKELGTCPVRQIGGCSFFYMRISNVYIVIVVSSNANVACAFKFVVEAGEGKVLFIRRMRWFFPFLFHDKLYNGKVSVLDVYPRVLQIFLDIVESVNLLMSSKGGVLHCDVTGKVLMKCFLFGMPDLKLGLNETIGLEKDSQLKSRAGKSGKTIELNDVTFHQCVNLTRFNAEKTVSVVPPDGEFELMKYRITEGVNLPFRVLPTIKELGRTRVEVNIKVKSVFSAKVFALGVFIKILVPKQTAKTSFQITAGRAKIRKFPGQTEPTMSAEVELISTVVENKSWTRPPIQMEFQVPMFTASGLRVRFLKVWEKNGYNTVEWVRYITKAGSYEIRC